MKDQEKKQGAGQPFTVFIDRDGVINRDSPDYIKSVDEFKFLPGSLEAFRILNEHHFQAVVVTNQSVINRGMTSREELQKIFDVMKQAVSAWGGFIKDIMFCPHTPEEDCDCRKPKPGMISAAVEKHGIDLRRSVMIGDSAKDILCARNAGVASAVLVRTGNGLKAEQVLRDLAVLPDHVADDLLAAVKWIVSNDTP